MYYLCYSRGLLIFWSHPDLMSHCSLIGPILYFAFLYSQCILVDAYFSRTVFYCCGGVYLLLFRWCCLVFVVVCFCCWFRSCCPCALVVLLVLFVVLLFYCCGFRCCSCFVHAVWLLWWCDAQAIRK